MHARVGKGETQDLPEILALDELDRLVRIIHVANGHVVAEV
jgi:hypothetical protein